MSADVPPGDTGRISNNSPSGRTGLPSRPYTLDAVTLVGGSIRVDRAALARFSAQLFGEDPGTRVASDELFVDFGEVSPQPGMQPPMTKPWSFVVIRMLVEHEGSRRGVVTHAFLDRITAASLGREVFGFPALPAVFAFVKPDGTPAGSLGELLDSGGHAHVSTDVLGENSAGVRTEPIVKLSFGPTHEEAPAEWGHWIWEQLHGAHDQPEKGGRLLFLQLKQLRDAIDPARACYQRLVSGHVETSEPSRKRLVHTQLTLHDFRTLTLASSLGIPAEGRVEPGMPARGYCASGVGMHFEIDAVAPAEVVRSGRDGAPFRFRSGDPQFAPSYEFENVSFTGFRLPISLKRVKELVDEQLNAPFPNRGYRYEPASAEVVVECLDYRSMRSAHPPQGFRVGDSERQRELIFRVLVGRVDPGSCVAKRPALFCPSLFVDSNWSLISGREVVGYPKNRAKFRGFEQGGALQLCRVDAYAPTGALAPVVTLDCGIDTSPETLERLGTLEGVEERDDSELSDDEWSLSVALRKSADHLWWNVDDLGAAHDLESFIHPWLRGGVIGYGIVQAKRFPDARATEEACYAEVLEGDYTVRNLQVAVPLHRATLDFAAPDYFNLDAELGLKGTVIVPAGSWYHANCDFRVRILDPLD